MNPVSAPDHRFRRGLDQHAISSEDVIGTIQGWSWSLARVGRSSCTHVQRVWRVWPILRPQEQV